MIKRLVKYSAITLLSILGIVILFLACSITTIDRTPYREQSFYQEMKVNLSGLNKTVTPAPQSGFVAGFAKENITPSYRISTAGYGNRNQALFTSVHDSIFVRTLVISNGAATVALVTADMLIIPPTITRILEKKLPAIGFSLDNTFLSATHTHNSIGNWGEHPVGNFYTGNYNDSIVNFVADKIIQSIVKAKTNLLPSAIKAGHIPVENAVSNRIKKGDKVDNLLRVLELKRSDSTSAILASFTAHATSLYSRNLEISRDYPGKLVDELEARGYTFAMFMAGAVGSHGCPGPVDPWEKIDYLGTHITDTFMAAKDSLHVLGDTSLQMVRIPLALGNPQLKISKDWRIRPWLFRVAFGEYPSFLTAVRIGDVIMLGTPCDFSGELTGPIDSTARAYGVRSMVTSFNGGYIGYITHDKRYDLENYETRLMNWYGPGNGAYLSESMMVMIESLSRK